jgi:hypothetical protein
VTVAAQSTTPEAPWAENQYGHRMIADPATGEIIGYQRTSSFAKVLDDKEGLIPWKAWCAVKGAHILPGVAAQARHSPKAPKGLIEELAQAGGSGDAARTGTARHQILAMAITGAPLPDMPPDARAELDAILRLVSALGIPVAVEAATVNDEYRCAGSVDLVLQGHDGRTVVCDFKTGERGDRLSWSIQLIAHARANYWADGTRAGLVAPDLPRLIVLHAPRSGSPPEAVDLDPVRAKKWARLAVEVREARKQARRKD